MDSLLANYLSVGDLIVVHLCGQKHRLELKKTCDCLGLTVTDNGQGRAFVKRVDSKDTSIEKVINPGDHIAFINNESVIGLRHYEVAQILRHIPLGSSFTLDIIKPRRSQEEDNERQMSEEEIKGSNNPKADILLASNPPKDDSKYHIGSSSLDDLIDSSLPIDKLLSKNGTETGANVKSGAISQDLYKNLIKKVNSILESFLGIHDDTLAIQIYRLVKDSNNSFEKFSSSINSSELNCFEFSHDIRIHLWNCVNNSL